MKYAQGDIVLVPFPFTDLTSTKMRPAVVVSNKNLKGNDLIVCGITSKSQGKGEVEIQNTDMSDGGLPLTSYVKLGKIVTLDQSIIKGTLGTVNMKKYAAIRKGVMRLFE